MIQRDPLAAWRAARANLDAVLDPAAAARPAPAFVLQDRPDDTLGDFLANLSGDLLCHAWDIGSVLGVPVEVDAATLEVAWGAGRRGLRRGLAFFAPEVPLGDDGAPFDRFLAFHGRDPRA